MKHRTGYLIKRSGNYYVGWTVNKKSFCKVLRTDDGKTITDKRQAEAAQDKFMEPFRRGSAVEVLEKMTQRLQA